MSYLEERLTYDKLFRISEPKRVRRSLTVRGPPLEIEGGQNAETFFFNFKSNPSTTGLRHKGYVKFFKPRRRGVPLQRVECLVDCTCPDYKFRWAWANKQRGSGRVGPQSLNQAWNQAPRITNPGSRPGLCKHILAARDFIYGLVSKFEPGTPDTTDKLDRLTRAATKRWANFPAEMEKAREREQRFAQARQARNIGRPVPDVDLEAPPGMEPDEEPAELPPLEQVPPPPLAVPPGERGRMLPKTEPTSVMGKITPPGQRGRQLPGQRKRKEESVVRTTFAMNTAIDTTDAKAALKIVEDMMDDAKAEALPAGSDDAPPPAPDMDSMEPPVSDSAVGADTEGATALGLLGDIAGSLQTLVTALAPEEEEAPPGEEDEGEPEDVEKLEAPEDELSAAPSEEEDEAAVPAS